MECYLPVLVTCFRLRKLVLRLSVLSLCLFIAPLSAKTPVTGVAQATRQEYVLWYRNYDSPAVRALVELALQKTPEYGEFRIIRSEELSQGRVLRELADGQSRLVDIANVATSAEREDFLTAIPFPVDGGLLGFRVCVVQPESLPRFADIENLEDLRARKIRIGQGSHWPDTPVLEANGIPVVTHSRYEILFGMLRNERFDCFARGVSEVLYDLEMEQDPNLVIEPNLLIAYPMPSYLFVGPKDHETAHRLQLGIERAILDGSFSEFLKRYYARAVKELNLNRRQVIALENPFLSEESRYVGRSTLENLRRRLDLFSH
ncbi:amino acid ABC transporter substrate-binding protein [Marinobacter sp. BW6]|uniref:amino acid ABC transporter substrate-binding protein n=1 Tax=Marinobacter sp. BW6 TaxID=2592624 RepID=UPI0011DEF820|nr:amino acid ABC transporter substrate-binding protein [Marinobacter sp. BW6]TYC62543.1 amino acid ABC transporter substrate-binding protein [Marinobacter sp. BW6]